jgi:hypothetical protein
MKILPCKHGPTLGLGRAWPPKPQNFSLKIFFSKKKKKLKFYPLKFFFFFDLALHFYKSGPPLRAKSQFVTFTIALEVARTKIVTYKLLVGSKGRFYPLWI